VILPGRNRKDLEDVPQKARQKLEFVFLDDVEEALNAAIKPAEEFMVPSH
jgi:ATP-dependent Lon protease